MDEVQAGADHERQCWTELSGGLAAPTSYPLRQDMGLDVWFPKRDDAQGKWDAGWYRGHVASAFPAVPTGKQKQRVTVDFPEETTFTQLSLDKTTLLPAAEQPAPPEDTTRLAAMAAPPVDATDAREGAFGLTDEQREVLENLWYRSGHYSGRDTTWRLLGDAAEAAGATPWYGIRQRQLMLWLKAQEARQLFTTPQSKRVTMPFDLPAEPLRNIQLDSLDMGAYAGRGVQRERWVQVAVDPATRFVWATIRGGAVRDTVPASNTADGVVAMLRELRAGPLKYSPSNANNVFGPDGKLLRPLRASHDGGSEFKPAQRQQDVRSGRKRTFGDLLRDKLTARGTGKKRALADPERVHAKQNLGQTPTQAAFVERANGRIRAKLRMAIQAEHGVIKRGAAQEYIEDAGWKRLLARAVKAMNNEVSRSTGLTAQQYMEAYLAGELELPEAAQEHAEEAQAARKRMERLTVGSRVRLVNKATQKAELRGRRKMEPRWSEELYTVRQVNRRDGAAGNAAYSYMLAKSTGAPMEGTYQREELLIVPALETEYVEGPPLPGSLARLEKPDATGLATIPRRGVRDGDTWAEQRVAELAEADRTGGLTRSKLLWRLVAYLQQSRARSIDAVRAEALERLEASVTPFDKKKAANAGTLAILGAPDE